ncbi:dicarboxylate/amino acid:cation symporter [Thermovibrio ammonificans]|uniref:Sodium:dicarboxylate symporter n=1 Tax=Thermovibrio ammonificans (strain DSM 15698 / JCM 12110 / HB-1) TaxID=648996 RepID=E8T6M0_THEA1|nr:dicarboxylate/amino acid:cation symporter [Thermovibrio ammonificans]ADU96804.1 sodium:dicarboxylate symporter [Thermovibrio ammonificans HB-1]
MKGRFVAAMVAGVVAGFLVGGLFPQAGLKVKVVGELFLNALKMVVLPLIVVSIANAVLNMETLERFRSIGLRALVYYTTTTALAVATGLAVVILLKPGEGVKLAAGAVEVKKAGFSLESLVTSLVPPNLFEALVNFNVLGVIVATMLFSLAAISVEWERELLLKQVLEELDTVLMRLTGWIVRLAPVGIFALIAYKVAAMGGAQAVVPVLKSLGKYTATVLLGLAVHGFITLPLIYFVVTRENPYKLLLRVKEALITAFATASSSATLPVTIERAVEAGVKREVAEFTLPLGATVNMDGTALYEAVAAIFLAQSYGIELSLPQYLAVFLTATLAAIGAAGIPEAGLVTMVLVLKSIGVPLEGIGIILAIDWFLDRCRTAVNVLGDIIGAAIISRSVWGK